MSETELDLLGLKCPLPALRTARALDALQPGDTLLVTASDPLATLDIPNVVRERGDALLDVDVNGTRSVFRIERRRPRE